MPISTFPRHDYDEDEYILKTAGLRDTHSEGKVIPGNLDRMGHLFWQHQCPPRMAALVSGRGLEPCATGGTRFGSGFR